MPLGPLSINLATLNPQAPLEQVLDACSRRGIRAVGMLRQQIARVGSRRAASMVGDLGLKVTSLVRIGPLTADTPAERRAAIDEAKQAIEEAAELRAACLVVFAGGLPAGSRSIGDAREMVATAIAEVLPDARAAGIPLAIEPLHPMLAADRSCINTVEHALDMCDELGAGTGVIVDTYHTWWDPKLKAQIARAGRKAKILGYHISDWLVPTRDMLLDRGMIGDGVIDLRAIGTWIASSGYTESPEIEIFSATNWWTKPADEVIKVCIERFELTYL